jgi:hypothetical protein
MTQTKTAQQRETDIAIAMVFMKHLDAVQQLSAFMSAQGIPVADGAVILTLLGARVDAMLSPERRVAPQEAVLAFARQDVEQMEVVPHAAN